MEEQRLFERRTDKEPLTSCQLADGSGTSSLLRSHVRQGTAPKVAKVRKSRETGTERRGQFFRHPIFPCTSDRALWEGLADLTSAAMVRRGLGVNAELIAEEQIDLESGGVPSIRQNGFDTSFELLVWVELVDVSRGAFELQMPETELSGRGRSADVALIDFCSAFEERMVMGYLQDTLFLDRRMAGSTARYKRTVRGVARITARFGDVIGMAGESTGDVQMAA